MEEGEPYDANPNGKYNDKNYLGVIDEEIINYNEDTSDDDLIFPNLNYLTTF